MKSAAKRAILFLFTLCLFFPSFATGAEEPTAPVAEPSAPTADSSNTEAETATQPPNEENTIIHNIIPKSEQERKQEGSVELQYNKYPLGNYSLDLYLEEKSWWQLDDKAADTGHYFLHSFNNMVWFFNFVFARFVIMVVENAFQFNLVDSIADTIGKAIQDFAGFSGSGLDSGLWGLFVTAMLVLAGTWAAYVGIARRETTRGWTGMLACFLCECRTHLKKPKCMEWGSAKRNAGHYVQCGS